MGSCGALCISGGGCYRWRQLGECRHRMGEEGRVKCRGEREHRQSVRQLSYLGLVSQWPADMHMGEVEFTALTPVLCFISCR